MCERVYEKVVACAGRLVPVAREIQEKYGVPIVNQRVAVTPIADVVAGGGAEACVQVAHALDAAAAEIGIDFVGGFSAQVQKGFTERDAALIDAIPAGDRETERGLRVGQRRLHARRHQHGRRRAHGRRAARDGAGAPPAHDSIGCAKIVTFCNQPEDNPFMAGAMHGSGEPETCVNVAISGPGVIASVVKAHPELSFTELADLIKRTTFKITRVGELVAREASEMLGAQLGIIDLSMAPTPKVGDSVAEILEGMGLDRIGAPGSTAALAMLNDAVKKGGTMATSSTGGLSGAFIPVSEDAAMAQARGRGHALHREARGNVRGLFARSRHDRRAGRHLARRPRRHDGRRAGHRHDQQQDDRRPADPRRRARRPATGSRSAASSARGL